MNDATTAVPFTMESGEVETGELELTFTVTREHRMTWASLAELITWLNENGGAPKRKAGATDEEYVQQLMHGDGIGAGQIGDGQWVKMTDLADAEELDYWANGSEWQLTD